MSLAQRRVVRTVRDEGGCACLQCFAGLYRGRDAINKAASRRKSLRTVEDKEEWDFSMQQAVTHELVRVLRQEGQFPLDELPTKSTVFGLAADMLNISPDGSISPGRAFSKESSKESFTNVRRTGYSRHSFGNITKHPKALKISWPITFQMAEHLRDLLAKTGGGTKPIGEGLVVQMLNKFCSEYREQHPEPVARVSTPPNGKVVVVGDVHGQLADVLLLFKVHGPPSAGNVYVFNGDIADRGEHACEIFLLLMAYFFACPTSVIINRGNHEEPKMNTTTIYEGGGFFDEVLSKFSSPIYACFVEMFKVLSLCTLIDGQVFVVHGGLSRANTTLQMINDLDHTSQTSPDFGGPDELSSSELLWVDLIWSDPCDEVGCYENDRGIGCYFGPDKTSQFLHSNPDVKLIIRSHELPESNTGFCKHHSDRCVTLFSASNYCGDSGNKAAVMTFGGAMRRPSLHRLPSLSEVVHPFAKRTSISGAPQDSVGYQVHEYYAPALETIGDLADNDEPAKRWLQAGEKSFADFNSIEQRDQDAWMKEVQKVMVAIVEYKPDIWAKFMKATGGDSLVTFRQWVNIMSSTLVATWDWPRLWDHWQLGGADGQRANFVDFLRRFTVTLTQEEYLSFTLSAICEVYHELIDNDASMKEALMQFDKDGDGRVDAAEMIAAMDGLDTSLSKAQRDLLVNAVFQGEREGIPVGQFFSRLSLVFRHASIAMEPSAALQEDRLLDEALQKIASVMAETPLSRSEDSPNAAFCTPSSASRSVRTMYYSSPTTKSGKCFGRVDENETLKMNSEFSGSGLLTEAVAEKFTELFAKLDADGSGDIDPAEFASGLWKIDAIRVIELSNGETMSEKILETLARRCDRNQSGSISLWEFLSQFEVENQDVHEDVRWGMVDNVISVLLRHRNSIRAGLAYFDRTNSGIVRKTDFENVLRALNQAIAKSGHHWSSKQISNLCDALVMEEDEAVEADAPGWIEYRSVFDSLQVVDSNHPDMGIRLGRSTTH
jgi:protein phosphatase